MRLNLHMGSCSPAYLEIVYPSLSGEGDPSCEILILGHSCNVGFQDAFFMSFCDQCCKSSKHALSRGRSSEHAVAPLGENLLRFWCLHVRKKQWGEKRAATVLVFRLVC